MQQRLIRGLLLAVAAIGGFVVVAQLITQPAELGMRDRSAEMNTGAGTSTETIEVRLAGQAIEADVMRSAQERSRGLSGREKLSDDSGMLFVFPVDGQHSFWMKDMNFPIDIIWIDRSKRVVHVKNNAQPSSYPRSFRPEHDARYVLEVAAGFARRHKIERGEKVSFTLTERE